MPALSEAQRRLMAIAEHHPSEVYAKNRGVLNMSHGQLHDFAATKEKGLPKRKSLRHRLTKRRMKKGA
jgi:hypothetical protein